MPYPRLVRVVVFGAALVQSRGLVAQGVSTILERPGALLAPADQSQVRLRGFDLRFVPREPLRLRKPNEVKALYVNAWAFSGRKLWDLVRLADSTEINSLVVDVKDDTGCLLYHSAVPTAREIGADQCARIASPRARLDTLLAHGIYPIARIVVAKDPLLAVGKTAWSVQQVGGGQWRDRINIAWVDAYNDSVWIYAADLAREAVRMGFAEVQFDYVRFPDEPKERMETAIFPSRRAGESQREAVHRHIQLIVNRIKPLGVPVTFDIFGLTASTKGGDLGIGQVWEDFAGAADVVLPMVYPSHYYRGAFGIDRPNAHPYRIVHLALNDALERCHAMVGGAAQVRPYLQAFTLGRRLPRYTPFEIREQIRATEDLGIHSWVLWNPRSAYQRNALRPYSSKLEPAALAVGSGQ
ncbi:MAG TPA: putative glycoside hydrolase [Gemmatimonadales bacterium]|nr:putative glycoside hydrolase [Gemmatimonadales bacterium]